MNQITGLAITKIPEYFQRFINCYDKMMKADEEFTKAKANYNFFKDTKWAEEQNAKEKMSIKKEQLEETIVGFEMKIEEFRNNRFDVSYWLNQE